MHSGSLSHFSPYWLIGYFEFIVKRNYMSNKKVLLVVEDDLGLQKQFKWSFVDYKVVIAGDKTEAINALRRFSPSV